MTKRKLTHSDEMALRQTEFLTDSEFDRFAELIDRGSTPTAALMFASRRAPGVRNTDRAFNERARRRMEGMSTGVRENIVQIAQQAGISTQGKFYVGGLGRYNDPKAWVSDASDIIHVARERRMNVSGAVNYNGMPDDIPPPKKVELAADIVDDFERRYVASDPKLREQIRRKPNKRQELRERIIATHGSKK